jgi:hypothetical protein
MKASHQAFLKFATCGACRLTIAGLGMSILLLSPNSLCALCVLARDLSTRKPKAQEDPSFFSREDAKVAK